MIDYHIHADYSIDAEGTVEQFCEVAANKGLKEIAFTTHVDADRTGQDHFVMVRGRKVDVKNGLWLEEYENHVRTAGDELSGGGLKVLLGAELDCYPDVEHDLPERFFSTDFDIILGSVHLIDHVAISAGSSATQILKKYSAEELGAKYFSTLLEAVECKHFDVLAHLDLYKRFGEQYYGDIVADLWRPHIEELATKMHKNEVGFEINTSPWRRGGTEAMPGPKLMAALVDRGISTITLGTDAHRPADVGTGINRAIDELKRIGVNTITRFSQRRPKQTKI
jgi:histidinol-phosphatase (PHP family)